MNLLGPDNLPEAAFESYEWFKSDASAQKAAFLRGEARLPAIAYPHLADTSRLERGIERLRLAMDKLGDIVDDDEFYDIARSSLGYRATEMEYVRRMADFNRALRSGAAQKHVEMKAEEARLLNDELYGRSDPVITTMALNEVWAQLDGKLLSPSARTLYDELESGFLCMGRQVSPLRRPRDQSIRLPKFDEDESMKWARERLLALNGDALAAVDEYWRMNIEQAVRSFGARPAASGEDVARVFESVVRLRGPGGRCEINILRVPGGKFASWDTSLKAIKIGLNRPPVFDREEIVSLVIHEFSVHALRAINGLNTEFPILGMGLFTKTEPSDYLGFEEGAATILAQLATNTVLTWQPKPLSHYINISNAEEGDDFRAVFEKAWRYCVLMSLKDGEDVSESLLAEAKDMAYYSVVRVFRGVPFSSRWGVETTLTCNRDLAYLRGRVSVMHYLRDLWRNRDELGFERIFMAKFDPTNLQQLNVVRRVFR